MYFQFLFWLLFFFFGVFPLLFDLGELVVACTRYLGFVFPPKMLLLCLFANSVGCFPWAFLLYVKLGLFPLPFCFLLVSLPLNCLISFLFARYFPDVK